MKHELTVGHTDGEVKMLIVAVDKVLTRDAFADINAVSPAIAALLGRGAFRVWYDDSDRSVIIQIGGL